MVTLVDLYRSFGITVSVKKTWTMSLPISHKPATPTESNATRQYYREATSFVYLGYAITASPKLSAEVGHLGWMARQASIVTFDVIEDVLYGYGA